MKEENQEGTKEGRKKYIEIESDKKCKKDEDVREKGRKEEVCDEWEERNVEMKEVKGNEKLQEMRMKLNEMRKKLNKENKKIRL